MASRQTAGSVVLLPTLLRSAYAGWQAGGPAYLLPVQVRLGVSCSWPPCLPAPSNPSSCLASSHHAVELGPRLVTLRPSLCPAGPSRLPGLPALLDIVPGTWSLASRPILSATRGPTNTIRYPQRALGSLFSDPLNSPNKRQYPGKGLVFYSPTASSAP